MDRAGIFIDALQHFLTTGEDIPAQISPADEDSRPSEVCLSARCLLWVM